MGDETGPRTTTTRLEWTGGLAFTARVPDGHAMTLDAGASGPSPVEALLASVGGCMGIDVAMILGKMRCPPSRLALELEAESMPEPPRYFRRMRLEVVAAGENLTLEKLERAVALSREKYCSVMLTLRPDLEVEIASRVERGSNSFEAGADDEA